MKAERTKGSSSLEPKTVNHIPANNEQCVSLIFFYCTSNHTYRTVMAFSKKALVNSLPLSFLRVCFVFDRSAIMPKLNYKTKSLLKGPGESRHAVYTCALYTSLISRFSVLFLPTSNSKSPPRKNRFNTSPIFSTQQSVPERINTTPRYQKQPWRVSGALRK